MAGHDHVRPRGRDHAPRGLPRSRRRSRRSSRRARAPPRPAAHRRAQRAAARGAANSTNIQGRMRAPLRANHRARARHATAITGPTGRAGQPHAGSRARSCAAASALAVLSSVRTATRRRRMGATARAPPAARPTSPRARRRSYRAVAPRCFRGQEEAQPGRAVRHRRIQDRLHVDAAVEQRLRQPRSTHRGSHDDRMIARPAEVPVSTSPASLARRRNSAPFACSRATRSGSASRMRSDSSAARRVPAPSPPNRRSPARSASARRSGRHCRRCSRRSRTGFWRSPHPDVDLARIDAVVFVDAVAGRAPPRPCHALRPPSARRRDGVPSRRSGQGRGCRRPSSSGPR